MQVIIVEAEFQLDEAWPKERILAQLGSLGAINIEVVDEYEYE